MKHLVDNQIITVEHHGGLPNYSTMSAKAIIDYYGTKASEDNRQAGILSTDLSAAYDTNDCDILLTKPKYYGFKDEE